MQVLNIHLTPQSRRDRVVHVSPNSFRVYVTQPAQKGKANKGMLHVLAKYLQVRPSDLILSKGERSQDKTVVLLDDNIDLSLSSEAERFGQRKKDR